MLPQANRDQLPSKALGKGKSQEKNKKYYFIPFPSQEWDRRKASGPNLDSSLMSHNVLACKDLGTTR